MSLGLVLVATTAVCVRGWLKNDTRHELVVYCAHDSVYSQAILDRFESETGISVRIRFDTEATKSLGLIESIIRERHRPRCDVLWNNEQLGTMRLQGEGLLLPYKGLGYDRIPDAFKAADGTWTGFGARMRVWIVNTDHLQADEASIQKLLRTDPSRVAIAKPLFGTTRTHYTVLWDHWGSQRVHLWHQQLRRSGVIEASGNGTVKNLVASGVCYAGLTDTDDFFAAQDAGKPVAMMPFRLEDGQTIAIPNTVAIIRGTRRPAAAQRLVDFLLSQRIELELARSGSRQIPLGPVQQGDLPDEVRSLSIASKRAYPLAGLVDAAANCLEWLKVEYVR